MINKLFCEVKIILKNSLISRDISENYFLVIKNKNVDIGENYIFQKGKGIANFFNIFDEERLLVLEDIMYIEFKDDITHVEKNKVPISEMINDDMSFFDDLKNKLPKIWDFVKDDFKELITKRNYTQLAYPYIIDIEVNSTYCSYIGDGDVYYFIKGITKFNTNGEEKFVKFKHEPIYY